MLGVQALTSDWKGIQFTAIGNALAGLDWCAVSGRVVLPEKTAHVAIQLMIEGDGQVWLDYVEVTTDDGATASSESAAPKVPPPPKPANAWSPGEGYYPAYPNAWRQFHQSLVERSKKGGVTVAFFFFGDSLTQGWDKALWKEKFEPLGAANYGVGGDGTSQVFWRIENGELEGISPKVFVLMIGVNNSWPGISAADTAKGMETIVAKLREKNPDARILLLGVLPIFDKSDPIRKWIKDINASVIKLAEGDKVRFLDLGAKFLEDDGSRKKNFYNADRLHLLPDAYKVLAQNHSPRVAQEYRTRSRRHIAFADLESNCRAR